MPRERGLIGGVAPQRAGRADGRRAQAAWPCALALGAALAAATPSAAATLREVRIGRHAEYTRIVFETDAPVRYRVTRDAKGELRVQLEASASPRRVPSKSEVLREVAVESEGGGSVARLTLQRGEVDVREMVLENPPRIVLDLMPRAAGATALAERAKPRPSASEKPRPERTRAPVEAPRPTTVARAAPAVPAPAADAVAEVRPAPTPPLEPSPEPPPDVRAAEAPAPAPVPAAEEMTVRPASDAPVAPAPEVAEASTPTPVVEPTPAPVAQPTPAPAAQTTPTPVAMTTPTPAAQTTPATVAKTKPGVGEGEPPREAPLELQLVAPQGLPVAGDPASARLAKAERDLDKLAGVPSKPRDKAAAVPAPEPRAEPSAVPAPAAGPEPVAAPRAEPAPALATTPALADPAASGAASPPTGGAPVAVPPGGTAPVAALAAPSAAAAPADAAAPTADARKEKRAKRARAPFRPTLPVEPSPLAFLPSPFDDPLVLGGIGALLGLIGALAVVRRRASRADDVFASPFDAVESVEADLAGVGGTRERTGTAAFEPVSGSPVATPTAEMGPLFASATVVSDDDEASIFDVTAEEAVGEDVDTPAVPAPPAFEPARPAFGATASAAIDEMELTEEEMRLIEELERRLGHLETRLEEVVDAKERLERHVAAQTEELRVQRAAIARTQRVLRTVVKPDDVATEPVAKT